MRPCPSPPIIFTLGPPIGGRYGEEALVLDLPHEARF